MAQNRGKDFEDVIRESFEKVPHTSVIRLPDPTMGYLGYSNICDFIVYHYPHQYFIECKSVHGNTLSIHSTPKPDKRGVLHGYYGNITDNQFKGLSEVASIRGVHAGVMCWWIDRDITAYISIGVIRTLTEAGYKSINVNELDELIDRGLCVILLKGRKKRVFFDYRMDEFFKEVNETCLPKIHLTK